MSLGGQNMKIVKRKQKENVKKKMRGEFKLKV
jgi:hypothetical protein